MKVQSLSFRLFISSGFVLTAFFALVAFVMEQGFRESTEQALKETLQVHLYSLLAVAEMTDSGIMKIPRSLREPRFSNPSSGLYAAINQTDNTLVWRSASAIGIDLSPSLLLKPGELIFVKDSNSRFVLHYSIIWENKKGIENSYVFTVAEDESFVIHQVDGFRLTLRTWLFFIGILLVFIQYFVLRWSLKPLRIIVNDLEEIEAGKKTRLNGYYPFELKGLADNLNALISSERAHLERYRNTLSDLAHSLKTPLAILRGCIDLPTANKETVNEQIARMDDIVEYQLQKAAAKGQKKLTGKVDIVLIVNKIILSLKKVYSDKQIVFYFSHDERCFIYAEQGDVYEIVGNLLDNASKWCDHQVKISLIQLERDKNKKYSLLLKIEDDGKGIPKHKLDEILQRGVRADENTKGYGIGMAVVNELTVLLDGQLIAGTSKTLGGMKWQVYFP
ncbi:MAG: GHKL domain-containing protein [Methylococcales symbiont of Iophon sp. n. MRB-2018]|nr:MAG: GHKL domain-containing protein [Methylococcales symbiont of Iophon sp. n. MRB-2018]KAF3979072.1 MAG: GHKL domain-containing protein [Methylococcales symbiont of Iophon sp. n. MRB-2018]